MATDLHPSRYPAVEPPLDRPQVVDNRSRRPSSFVWWSRTAGAAPVGRHRRWALGSALSAGGVDGGLIANLILIAAAATVAVSALIHLHLWRHGLPTPADRGPAVPLAGGQRIRLVRALDPDPTGVGSGAVVRIDLCHPRGIHHGALCRPVRLSETHGRRRSPAWRSPTRSSQVCYLSSAARCVSSGSAVGPDLAMHRGIPASIERERMTGNRAI